MCTVRRWGIDASDPRWGDGHYYDYTGDCLDTRVYPRSKFVSEFGFQSYPSFNVLKNVTVAEDWSYTSSMMNYRFCSSLIFAAMMLSSTGIGAWLLHSFGCIGILHHFSMYTQ